MGSRRLTESKASSRTRSIGVIMVAVGLGFSLMISLAASSPSVGLGIGGAFALLGVGFIVNAILMNRTEVIVPELPVRNRTDAPDRPSSLP
jgi:hypothetical protein